MSKRRFASHAASDLAWQPPDSSEPANFDRLSIDACLETPLTEREWNLLEIQGFIADIKERRRTPGQVATLVEQWREAVSGPTQRPRRDSVSAALRVDALRPKRHPKLSSGRPSYRDRTTEQSVTLRPRGMQARTVWPASESALTQGAPLSGRRTRCPSCNAPARADEAAWIDDSSAECAYCGATIHAD